MEPKIWPEPPEHETPKTEPAADLRSMANFCWQTFTALTDEGFSERQALTIIGQILVGAALGGGGDT
jgi:hypothetical protein